MRQGGHSATGRRKGWREGGGRGLHPGRGGELTSRYSHARGSRIQKRAEVRAREGGSRRRGLLSRRKVWGGRSPALGRQGPKVGRGRGGREKRHKESQRFEEEDVIVVGKDGENEEDRIKKIRMQSRRVR